MTLSDWVSNDTYMEPIIFAATVIVCVGIVGVVILRVNREMSRHNERMLRLKQQHTLQQSVSDLDVSTDGGRDRERERERESQSAK